VCFAAVWREAGFNRTVIRLVNGPLQSAPSSIVPSIASPAAVFVSFVRTRRWNVAPDLADEEADRVGGNPAATRRRASVHGHGFNRVRTWSASR